LKCAACAGCQTIVRDAPSLLSPHLQKSEVWGVVAGFGTTFAAVPDIITIFRRRSSTGMNPRMAGILAIFQVIWIYYGLLINSRPVIVWNLVAVLINSAIVGAVVYFSRMHLRG
jgi:MtN3 and saliva related transmembrane protein